MPELNNIIQEQQQVADRIRRCGYDAALIIDVEHLCNLVDQLTEHVKPDSDFAKQVAAAVGLPLELIAPNACQRRGGADESLKEGG